MRELETEKLVTLAPERQSAFAAPQGEPHGSESQWAVLAGLRFVLAMIVCVGHSAVYAPATVSSFLSDRLTGTAAVLGFLMISGYSIAHSITTKPDGYGSRRFWRIAPTYWVCLLMAVGVLVASGGFVSLNHQYFDLPDALTFGGAMLMLQGFAVPIIGSIFPSWSLAVEVVYYALAPLLRRLTLPILAVIVAVSILAHIAYEYVSLSGFQSHESLPKILIYAWAWISGFAFYRFSKSKMAAAMLIAPGLIMMPFEGTAMSSLVVVGSAILIYIADSIPALPASVSRLLGWLGDLSYPLYLVHIPAFIFAYELTGWRVGWMFVFAAILVATAVLHGVDYPMRSWVKANKSKSGFRFALSTKP